MTRESFKTKTVELIEQAKEELVKNIDHAISSGSMNIEASEDNYFLPRQLMIALLTNYATSNLNWMVQCHGKGVKKDIKNIEIML